MDTNPSTPSTPTTSSPVPSAGPDPGRPGRVGLLGTVVRRWPLVAGVVLGAFQIALDDPHDVSGVLMVLLLATTGYVVVAALVRPAWSWPVVGALTVLVVGSRLAGAPPTVVLVGLLLLCATAVVVGAVQGTWSRHDLYRWQPWSAAAFLGVSFAALAFDPDLGRVVVAVGLIGHTVWDVVHWRRREVVSRSLAEWCAGLDLTLGVGVLLVPLWM
jgi:hypothetical protein